MMLAHTTIQIEKTFPKEVIQMLVGEVMTRNVEVIGSNAPLIEAAAKMKNLDVGLRRR
jgi:CBS domain-containing protein